MHKADWGGYRGPARDGIGGDHPDGRSAATMRVPGTVGLDIGEPVRTVELPEEEPFLLPERELEPVRREREPEPVAG